MLLHIEFNCIFEWFFDLVQRLPDGTRQETSQREREPMRKKNEYEQKKNRSIEALMKYSTERGKKWAWGTDQKLSKCIRLCVCVRQVFGHMRLVQCEKHKPTPPRHSHHNA